MFSQLFGVLPCSKLYTTPELKLISIPVVISTVMGIFQSFLMFTVFYSIILRGLNLKRTTVLLYSVTCYVEFLMFIRISRVWPKITLLWQNLEASIFFQMPYSLFKPFALRVVIWISSAVVMINIFIEHFYYWFQAIETSEKHRTFCNHTVGFLENLYVQEAPFFAFWIPSNYFSFAMYEWLNLSMTYARSFIDIFIMCVSIGLTMRFNQIYMRINFVARKSMPPIFWYQVQRDFMALRKLMLLINNNITQMILISSLNNLYYICTQLFYGFSHVDNLVYFWYSLAFIVGKALMSMMASASIALCSVKIRLAIELVSSTSWSPEAENFSKYLNDEMPCFNGCGMFFVTRKLILGMAASVVTYEIYLRELVDITQANTEFICRKK
ncbi:Gr64b family protein [Megaselia abdita]